MMDKVNPDVVHFIHAVSIEHNIYSIMDALSSLKNEEPNTFSVPFFDSL